MSDLPERIRKESKMDWKIEKGVYYDTIVYYATN